MSDFSLTLLLQIKTSKIINDMAKVQQKSEKITAFGGIFFVLDKFDSILSSVIDSHLGLRMGTPAEVIHEPEHRIPAYHRHGSKFLPIHRGIAAHGRPLWNQGHGQGQEFPVQIHRRACQVDQNGKAVQTQHLLQQAIQTYLGTRIKQHPSLMLWSKPLDLTG